MAFRAASAVTATAADGLISVPRPSGTVVGDKVVGFIWCATAGNAMGLQANAPWRNVKYEAVDPAGIGLVGFVVSKVVTAFDMGLTNWQFYLETFNSGTGIWSPQTTSDRNAYFLTYDSSSIISAGTAENLSSTSSVVDTRTITHTAFTQPASALTSITFQVVLQYNKGTWTHTPNAALTQRGANLDDATYLHTRTVAYDETPAGTALAARASTVAETAANLHGIWSIRLIGEDIESSTMDAPGTAGGEAWAWTG